MAAARKLLRCVGCSGRNSPSTIASLIVDESYNEGSFTRNLDTLALASKRSVVALDIGFVLAVTVIRLDNFRQRHKLNIIKCRGSICNGTAATDEP